MRCPYCNSLDTAVVDTRAIEENTVIKRRRKCSKCNRRFTTLEKCNSIPFNVIKKDGKRENYDRNKLEKGIILSCYKRSIASNTLEGMIDAIEEEILDRDSMEIESRLIGDIVMKRLKKLDEVAYIRFASVYREFKDLGSFLDEIKQVRRD